MSNLIKAYSVQYTKDTKKLDMNERANEFQRLYIETRIVVDEEPKEDILNNIEQNFALFDSEEENRKDEEENFFADEEAVDEEQFNAIAEGIVTEAEEKAAEILKEAEAKATEILKEAEAKAEQLKAEAEKQGYDKGISDGNIQIDEMRRELEKEKCEIREEYEKQVQELEPAFVELVISLIKKLTGVLAESEKGIIAHLMREGILGTDGKGNYIIHVSRADYEEALAAKDTMKELLSAKGELEIVEDMTLSKNECYIETDSRVIDCGFETQFGGLLEDIKMIAGI